MKYSKKIISLLLSVVMVLGVCAAAPFTVSAEDSVYEIDSYAKLKEFASLVNGGQTGLNAKLTADIDASESASADNWTPIGNYSIKYTGIFDGDGHKITGLTYNKLEQNYDGLFGHVGSGGKVQNVGIEGGSITGGSYVGGVVGYNDGGAVTNCYNTGDVTSAKVGGGSRAGGVVGYNNGGAVTNCYNTGDVSSTGNSSYVGGVVGYNVGGAVTNCYNTGDVSSTLERSYAGGVVGFNYTNGTVTNCYNTGDVSSTREYSYAGGVVGENYDNSSVSNCYNTGDVTSAERDSYAGGVAGDNFDSSVSNCYNTGSVSGSVNVGGVAGWNDGEVTNCYNTGSVKATGNSAYAGGVAGYNNGTVINCYNTGSITATADRSYAGGVVGHKGFSSEVTNCYYDKSVCGEIGAVNGEDDDTNNVRGLTTEQMTGSAAAVNMKGLFADDGSSADWCITDSYPRLLIKIGSYAQLKTFASRVNGGDTGACAVLTADIDASASAQKNDWTPIGNGSKQYTGTFDGGGHTITGLTYNNSSTDYAGLFGCVQGVKDSSGAVIGGIVKNIGLEGGSITSGYFVGGVIGYNWGGTVTNCYNTGSVSGSHSVAGVVGHNGGSVENCYNTGSVSGGNYVGGVVGLSYGTVTNCYNTGAVSGNDFVGGVAGLIANDTEVTNCYYDSDRCAAVNALGYGSGTNVTGLTTAQMTGEASNDDDTMKALYDAKDDNGEKIWLEPKADSEDDDVYYWFYPHLKGFAYDTEPTAENWPAKLVINTSWDDDGPFTYDGEQQKPEPTRVVVSTLDRIPDELAGYEVRYYRYPKDAGEPIDPPTDPGNYIVEYLNGDEEVLYNRNFSIFETDDYTVDYQYREPDNEQWTGDADCVDAGEYRAVLKFEKYGDKTAVKDFVINPKPLTVDMINAIPDVTYTGSAQTPKVTVTDGENALVKGKDYTVSYSDNVNVACDANGNVIAGAKVTVTGKGNYTGSAEKNFTINPKAVTITANSDTKVYDGTALTNNGFTASALEAGGTHEFTVAMTPDSTITDFGTRANVIATVDGVSVTPDTPTLVGNYLVTTVNGTLTVTKATATVTITGHYNSAPYDGEEHSVSGYDVSISNSLYTESDFTFSGTAEANRTNSGTASMGLKSDQFANNNPNFEVIFNVTDGYQNIVPLNVEVTITGNSATADYDGQEHSASGYTATASNNLYDVTKDFTFSGTAEAKLTEPGTQNMGLDASQFTNTNTNFGTVTFVIAEDGKVTVNPVIKFVNEDGTVLQSSAYAMGETPEYKGETPTKAASDGCTYEFAGWTPAITEVTGNATYTAVYTSTAIGLELKEGTNDTTGYKEDQTFTVDTSNLPEGAEVHWFVNGEDVGTGSSYKVEDPTEDYTVQAKVIDKDGNVLAETETQKVHVKNGFFDRIKAFFTELIAQILGKAIADLFSSVC